MTALAIADYGIQNGLALNEIQIKRNLVNNMVRMGQQIPLREVMRPSEIFNLRITHHVIQRYKKRRQKMLDIEIENAIKADLSGNAVIVEMGHSDRWMVYAKGSIFIIDENCVYTVYDANGNDRNHILDPTKSKLAYATKKTRGLYKMKHLFEMIN